MKRFLAPLVLALGLTTAQTAPTAPAAPLLGTQWELWLIGTKTVTAERKPTLSFAEGRAGGYLGCNTGGGAYTLSKTSLQFGPLVSTMMACEPALMRLEQDFAAALRATLRYSLSPDGQTLRLVGTGKVLTFKRL
ncbi:MAG: META domain-containing protein [Meiothermus sp.]|nr:META domain-containing protein [Meiothermus sp.]